MVEKSHIRQQTKRTAALFSLILDISFSLKESCWVFQYSLHVRPLIGSRVILL